MGVCGGGGRAKAVHSFTTVRNGRIRRKAHGVDHASHCYFLPLQLGLGAGGGGGGGGGGN